jgi:hypothetical protein
MDKAVKGPPETGLDKPGALSVFMGIVGRDSEEALS